MLTYSFEKRGDSPIYEYLYEQIKNDIIERKLLPNQKLPSKRSFAKQLDVSNITVENAYALLLSEGFVYSVPKSGYYVSEIDGLAGDIKKERPEERTEKIDSEKSEWAEKDPETTASDVEKELFADFSSTSTREDRFPFSVWAKLIRKNMSEKRKELLTKSPSQGVYILRKAISNWLFQFRNLNVDPERIVIGAGTEYLYGIIIQLLGRDKTYALEDPGYVKIGQIYNAGNVKTAYIPLDKDGVKIDDLERSGADILHISPAHHFPTGIITTIGRRIKLLEWAGAEEGRYIIEDDYDSEFRMSGRPVKTLLERDNEGRVIYVNTFSKSLAQTIRISYMVLPEELMEKYKNEFSFYSCPVSTIEQYTLADFIENGYFEKHINRMRTMYKNSRNLILRAIREQEGNLKNIREEHAGLHFLLEADTTLSDEELAGKAAGNGIGISMLSSYYYRKENAPEHILIMNYSDIDPEKVGPAIKKLYESF